MKSKIKKSDATSLYTNDDQHASTGALSFFKNRFFPSSNKSTTFLEDTNYENNSNQSITDIEPNLSIHSQYVDSNNNLFENTLFQPQNTFKSDYQASTWQNKYRTTKSKSNLHHHTNQIIKKDGYLCKKSENKHFHKFDRPWKQYRVILCGHKLYLYKKDADILKPTTAIATTTINNSPTIPYPITTHSSPSHSSTSSPTSSLLTTATAPIIPSNTTSTSSASSTPSFHFSPTPSITSTINNSLIGETMTSPSSSTTISSSTPTFDKKHSFSLDESDFNDHAKSQLFPNTSSSTKKEILYASVFMELDRQRKQTIIATNLLIYPDCLIICKKDKEMIHNKYLWHIETTIPLNEIILTPFTLTTKNSSKSPLYKNNNSNNDDDNDYFLHNNNNNYNSSNDNDNINNLPMITRVNRFTLTHISQPWNEKTYISLSKYQVNLWMTTFYNAQRAFENGNDLKRIENNNNANNSVQSAEQLNMTRKITTPKIASLGTILFDPHSSHPGLIIETQDGNNIRSVQGGTIPALIHELLFETQNQGKEFTSSFLLTYTTFTNFSDMFDIIKGYVEMLKNTPMYVKLWNRLLNIFQIWCEDFPCNITGDLVTHMLNKLKLGQSIQDLPQELSDYSKEIHALILKTVKNNRQVIEFTQMQRSYNEGIDTVDIIKKVNDTYNVFNHLQPFDYTMVPQSPSSSTTTSTSSLSSRFSSTASFMDISHINATGLTTSLFLDMDPNAFAEQIYIFDYTQHYRYHRQSVNAPSYLPSPQVPPQMLNTLLFTSSSPHFLTRLIWNQILVEARMQQSESAMVLRTKLLEHWIRVGIALMKLKDMTGWTAVACGICSFEISRLKESWKTVDRGLVMVVSQIWSPLLTDHGIYSLDIWVEGWELNRDIQESFSEVLDVALLDVPIKQYVNRSSVASEDVPALTHFGPIKQSVERLRKHIPANLSITKGSSPSSSFSSIQIINYEASWCIYDNISYGLDSWKKLNQSIFKNDDKKKISLPFVVVKPLQVYFETQVHHVSSVPNDFKFLHECSLDCEPHLFGKVVQQLQQHQGQLDHMKRPMFSPLVFLDIPCANFNFFPKAVTSNLYNKIYQERINETIRNKSLVQPLESYGYLTRVFNTILEQVQITHSRDIQLTMVTRLTGKRKKKYWMEMDKRIFWFDVFDISKHQSKMIKQSVVMKRRNDKYNDGDIWIFKLKDRDIVFVAEELPDYKNNNKNRQSSSSTSLQENNNNNNNNDDDDDTTTILVYVRGASLNELVNLLIHGISIYQDEIIQLWNSRDPKSSSSSTTTNIQVILNDEEFIKVFFTTSGMFCTPKNLLLKLQDQIITSKIKGLQVKQQRTQQMQQEKKIKQKRRRMTVNISNYDLVSDPSLSSSSAFDTPFSTTSNSNNDENNNDHNQSFPLQQATSELDLDVLAYDWVYIAKIQLRVVHMVLYWIEKQFFNILGQTDTVKDLYQFILTAKACLEVWQVQVSQYYNLHYDYQNYQQHTDHLDNTDNENITNIQTALSIAETINKRLELLQVLLTRKLLSPFYDLGAIQYDAKGVQNADGLYRYLTSGKQSFSVSLEHSTTKMSTISLSHIPIDINQKCLIDESPATTILVQLNRTVLQFFGSVTLNDWIQTRDILASQSYDLYAWIPGSHISSEQNTKKKKKGSFSPSSLATALSCVIDGPTNNYYNNSNSGNGDHEPQLNSEEIVINDVFRAIEYVQPSVSTSLLLDADNLLLLLPSSIQYLYYIHYTIRSWVIYRVTSSDIDLETRILRIEKFLQMVRISQRTNAKNELFTELKEANLAGIQQDQVVPGFVEYAIATALISPEVRLFTKAWEEVGIRYGVSDLDTLIPIIQLTPSSLSTTTSSSSSSSSASLSSTSTTINDLPDSTMPKDLLLVPSLAWIFDRFLELSSAVPSTYYGYIHFSKNRFSFLFLQMIINAQYKLVDQHQKISSTSSKAKYTFVISPNEMKRTWKKLKEDAYRENKNVQHFCALNTNVFFASQCHSNPISLSLKHGVFNKLVNAQIDMIKRDMKERALYEKESQESPSDQLQQHHQQQQEEVQLKKQLQHYQKKTDNDHLMLPPQNLKINNHNKKNHTHRRTASSSSAMPSSSTTSTLIGIPTVMKTMTPLSPTPSPFQQSTKWPSILRSLRLPECHNNHSHTSIPTIEEDINIESNSSDTKYINDDDAFYKYYNDTSTTPITIDKITAKAVTVINLIRATISISGGDEKRPFVFRIVTEEGAQYLFQCSNMVEMKSWMDEITEASIYGTSKKLNILAEEYKNPTMNKEIEEEKGENEDELTSTAKAKATTSLTSPNNLLSPLSTITKQLHHHYHHQQHQSKKKKGFMRHKVSYSFSSSKPHHLGVYGIPLKTLLQLENKPIPTIVTLCIKEIELRGLEEVGIYRIAGTGMIVQQLKKEFNTHIDRVNIDAEHYPDINVIADALKHFLRELPEPLLTYPLYEDFIKASASKDHDDRIYNIKKVLQNLPVENYTLLKTLIEHFVTVTDYESINHMYATNLAIVFGPTLLKPLPGVASFNTSMSHLGHQQNIVKYLILHYHCLFDVEHNE